MPPAARKSKSARPSAASARLKRARGLVRWEELQASLQVDPSYDTPRSFSRLRSEDLTLGLALKFAGFETALVPRVQKWINQITTCESYLQPFEQEVLNVAQTIHGNYSADHEEAFNLRREQLQEINAAQFSLPGGPADCPIEAVVASRLINIHFATAHRLVGIHSIDLQMSGMQAISHFLNDEWARYLGRRRLNQLPEGDAFYSLLPGKGEAAPLTIYTEHYEGDRKLGFYVPLLIQQAFGFLSEYVQQQQLALAGQEMDVIAGCYLHQWRQACKLLKHRQRRLRRNCCNYASVFLRHRRKYWSQYLSSIRGNAVCARNRLPALAQKAHNKGNRSYVSFMYRIAEEREVSRAIAFACSERLYWEKNYFGM